MNYVEWQGLRDSNPRPSVLETDALPTELNPSAATGRIPNWPRIQGLLANNAEIYAEACQAQHQQQLRIYSIPKTQRSVI